MSIYNYCCWNNNAKIRNVHTETEYTLIEDLQFADFTFKCSDGEVKAHRCILWSRCSFFKTASWDISSMTELPVDCDTTTMKKSIDFFYGRGVSFCEPEFDIAAFNILTMLNPSMKNITILIPYNTSKWSDLLDHVDKLPYSREQFIDEMAEHIIYDFGKYHLENYYVGLTTEILEHIFEYKILTHNDMLYLIRQIVNDEILYDQMNNLCKYIKWEYVSSNVVDKRIITIPYITPEMVRQAYLAPDYPKNSAGIYAVLRQSTASFTNTEYSYIDDYILVRGIYMRLIDIFKNVEEFNSILERDKHLKPKY